MIIYLVGYMGSGKSTLGRKLAAELELSFIDMDTEIEQKSGMSIGDIFALKGETGFREMERAVLSDLTRTDNVVIATGGGSPCYYDNMGKMNSSGLTIYLRMSVQTLASRLVNAKRVRPLVQGKSKEELTEYISEMLLIREPYYLKASIIIEGKDLNAADLAVMLDEHIKNN